MTSSAAEESTVLRRLRALLLGLVVFGALGLLAELVLLEHFESWNQWVPLVLLAATCVGAAAAVTRPSAAVVRAFRVVMVLAVVSGAIGTVLHYRSNAELEREIAPDRPAGEIFTAALHGGVPTLAPGAMIQLGLLGLLAVYRHPIRRA